MDTPRWQRLQTLFHEAAALDRPARAAFLREACNDDPELRAELESLLDASEGETRPLAASPDLSRIVDAFEQPDLVGERIGPYRLLRAIGHGGMGMVYLGERADGEFRQQVAIKLVRSPWLSSTTLTRFRAERQILARLEHPHIARLLDGGSTLQGQPYLVMEYVDGEPIDRYCARLGLSTDDRLRLFLHVCAAVAHAHRQLVIHRDLKPSNILVTEDGEVKLLDFGIAKLIDADSPLSINGDAQGPVTAVQGAALTPEYASPEQVRGEPVTTASDVYSLGILLYELLTGTALYRFTSSTLREVEKVVCETPVVRPSTIVGKTRRDNTAPTTSQRVPLRSDISPERLRRDLHGDLDTIVLTALHKEPDARYRSVEQMAEDIRRHLGGYPVLARPASRRYRLAKFLRRNALATVATAAVVLALIGGATAAWLGMLAARDQAALAESRRQELEQVVGFQQSMLSDLDPQAMGGGIVNGLRRQYRDAVSRRQAPDEAEASLAGFDNAIALVNSTDVARTVIDEFVLTRALNTLERDFSDQPQLQADLYDSLFAVYRAIGLNAPLIDIGERLIAARANDTKGTPADALKARARLAEALLTNSRLDDAETALRTVATDIEATLDSGGHNDGALRELLWRVRDLLAQTKVEQGDIDEALSLAQANRDFAAELPDPRFQRHALNSLGYISARSKLLDQALVYFREAVTLLDGTDSAESIRAHTNVAATLGSLGRLDESLEINERQLAAAAALLGERHPQTLRIMNNVAANLTGSGRAEEAARQLERIVELRREVSGEADALTLRSMLNLGSAYARAGRPADGLAVLETVTRQRLLLLGPEHLDTLQAQEVQASILSDLGRDEDAAGLATQAHAVALATFGERHPMTIRLAEVRAGFLNDTGRHADALAITTPLLAMRVADGTADDLPLRQAALLHYVALKGLGQTAQAERVRQDHLQALLDADPADLDTQRQRVRERIQHALGAP